MIQHARVGRAAQDGALIDALPGEQPADLSFLEFCAEPPAIMAREPPLKKLEFKELAPPARPVSPPEFVRKSPKKVAQEPGAEGGAAEAEAAGAGGGAADRQEVVPGAKVVEGEGDVREDIAEEAGEEVESVGAESPHGGEGESFHESYDGGLEDERAGDEAADRADDRHDGEQQAAADPSGSGDAGGAESTADVSPSTADGVAEDGGAGGAPTVEAVEGGEGDKGETEELQATGGDDGAGSGAADEGLEKPGDGKREEEGGEGEEEGGEQPPQSEQARPHMESLEPDVRTVINKARLGHTAELKEMIQADPTLLARAVDAHGNNLLHVAATNGKKDIIKEILRSEVLEADPDAIDVYARNKRGKNMLDCALDFNYTKLATYLQKHYPGLAGTPPPDASVQSTAAGVEESAAESESGEGGSSTAHAPSALESSVDAGAGGEAAPAAADEEAPIPAGADVGAAGAESSAEQRGGDHLDASGTADDAVPEAAVKQRTPAEVEEETAGAGAASAPPDGSADEEQHTAAEGTPRDADGEATDEEIQRIEQELEATKSKMMSLDGGSDVPVQEQSAAVELEESVAQLSASGEVVRASEGGVELDEPVEQLSVSPDQASSADVAGGAVAADETVVDLPVTPKKDEAAPAGTALGASGGGDSAIEEEVAADSPEPPLVDMTAGGAGGS